MRIGLASDSHGNVAVLELALEQFARVTVDRVFFLGGRVADLDAVLARRGGGKNAARKDPLAERILSVASRACPEYESGAVPRTQVDLLEGRICCLVNDKSELTRDDISNATVFFHGNSGHAALVQIGPRYFVTPGHLRAPAPQGKPPTFAILEADPRELVLTVFSGAGDELRQERASFAAQGKMSVR